MTAMTDYRSFFVKALSAAYKKAPMTDDDTFIRTVKERAKNMDNNNENNGHPGLIEITPVHTKPKKSVRVIQTVAGIAGAAALLAGAVFGVKLLNEYGGLKEGGIDTPDGPAAALTGAVTYDTAEPPLTRGILRMPEEEVFHFNGFDVELTGYRYDGMTLDLSYKITYENGVPDDYKAGMIIKPPYDNGKDVLLRTFGGGSVKINPVDCTRVISVEDNCVGLTYTHINCEVLKSVEVWVLTSNESAVPYDMIDATSYKPYKCTVEMPDDLTYISIDTERELSDSEARSLKLEHIDICQSTVGFVIDGMWSDEDRLDAAIVYKMVHLNTDDMQCPLPESRQIFNAGSEGKQYIIYSISTPAAELIKSVIVNGHEIAVEHPDMIIFDDLVGLTVGDARALLLKKHINFGIHMVESDDVPEGTVIRTEPPAGAAVSSSVTADIYVSAGNGHISYESFAEAG